MMIEDFDELMPFDLKQHRDIHILTAPDLIENRWAAIKYKIAQATGIPEAYLNISRISISMKNGYIAWITMDDEVTVNNIIKKAAEHCPKNFSTFPVLPEEVSGRKQRIEKILMEQKTKYNPNL